MTESLKLLGFFVFMWTVLVPLALLVGGSLLLTVMWLLPRILFGAW